MGPKTLSRMARWRRISTLPPNICRQRGAHPRYYSVNERIDGTWVCGVGVGGTSTTEWHPRVPPVRLSVERAAAAQVP